MVNSQLFLQISKDNNKYFRLHREYFNSLLKKLEGNYKKILYIKGEIIAKEGLVDDFLYFIERGKVILSRRDIYNREHTNGYLMAGEFFGASAMVDLPHTTSYRALTNCNVLAINKTAINNFLIDNHESTIAINKLLINAVRTTTIRQGNLMMGGCRSTFVNFILEHFSDFGRIDENNNVLITLDVNLSEIAQILNMTRETLSRIIGEMKREGIIETKRKFIKILDLSRFLA